MISMYHCNEIHNLAIGHDVILNKIELNWKMEKSKHQNGIYAWSLFNISMGSYSHQPPSLFWWPYDWTRSIFQYKVQYSKAKIFIIFDTQNERTYFLKLPQHLQISIHTSTMMRPHSSLCIIKKTQNMFWESLLNNKYQWWTII